MLRPDARHRIAVFSLITLIYVVPSAALGMDFQQSRTNRDECELRVEGEINAETYKKVLSSTKTSVARTICLNSSGGSWAEAVKLAKYVMDHFIGTYVDDGDKCYSACALVFLAGARKGFERPRVMTGGRAEFGKLYRLPDRTMHVRAKVGFHAPYLALDRKKYSRNDISTARVAALRAFAAILHMMGRQGEIDNHDNYLPKKFIARAMKMRQDELLMVDTIDKAGWLRVRLVGYKQPRHPSKRDLYWAAAKHFMWSWDESVEEFLAANKRIGYPIKYEEPYSYQSTPKLTRANYQINLFRSERVYDVYVELLYDDLGEQQLYIGDHLCSELERSTQRLVGNEKDKRCLHGITKILLKSGHRYLLAPSWYIYPAKTKLSVVVVD